MAMGSDPNFVKCMEKFSDDDKVILFGGGDTGNMNLAEFSEDDAANTVQNCGHYQHYAGNYEETIVSISFLL